MCLMSKSAAGTPLTRHAKLVGYLAVPSIFTSALLSTSDATVGPSTDTHLEVSAADCFRAPESTMTFTPAQGPAEVEAALALAEDAAEEAGAEELGELPAGAEQAARVSRRPAAAMELAAAVRVLVNVTCQG